MMPMMMFGAKPINFERLRIILVVSMDFQNATDFSALWITPFLKTESAERAIGIIQNDLRLTLKKQSKSAAGGADIDRLPEAVEHEHMLA